MPKKFKFFIFRHKNKNMISDCYENNPLPTKTIHSSVAMISLCLVLWTGVCLFVPILFGQGFCLL